MPRFNGEYAETSPLVTEFHRPPPTPIGAPHTANNEESQANCRRAAWELQNGLTANA